ncbi:cystathionine beta-lyase [Desulfuribacillus stibiiarsenatis]|uniref:cysteine-S-conjugate beta-lyase n=1 Tax=Desulfuribacillus stibiiarsenatis TaxID=1390249 RepID=A0A1E5L4N3_9FIRM|nr:MalY/PatB family protein [Desulfuribacillus stibiiarsenatis]OEH85066.1 cystathionine beta-lyase [Desulfuribacillus stibiiarsenatis]
MKHIFDHNIDRKNTNAVKWDQNRAFCGEDDVLPFWVADMDFPSPEPVVQALKHRAEHGIYGYTAHSESYMNSILNWVSRRHDWHIDKGWIATVPTVLYGITLIMRSFSEPGDHIVIQPPVYHPFARIIQDNDREIVHNELVYHEGRYEMDFDDLEEKLKHPKAKLFLLCSPHNPVGRVWTHEELKRVGELCIRHNVLIISDEIHWDIVLRGHKHIPMASISEEIAQRTFTSTAPTKTFNMAGLHISNMIIPNQAFKKVIDFEIRKAALNDNNVFGLTALENAYTSGEEWLDELLAYLEGNLQLIEAFAEEHWPKVKVIPLEGTYLVWLDVSALGIDGVSLQKRLVQEAKVALHMGKTFGSGGEGFIRMNIACPKSMIEQGLTQMKEILK